MERIASFFHVYWDYQGYKSQLIGVISKDMNKKICVFQISTYKQQLYIVHEKFSLMLFWG